MLSGSSGRDEGPPAPTARLHIVPLASVLPHEIADPSREGRIKVRLQEEGILRDPVMAGAVPDLESYVLLDGTNRRVALQQLGYPLILTQILPYADQNAVRLRTWAHAAQVPLDTLLRGAHGIPGIEISRLAPLGAQDALADSSTLAVLMGQHRRAVLSRLPGLIPRSQQLRILVDLYEERMTRVDFNEDEVDASVAGVPGVAEGEVSVVVFPHFSRAQVVQMAVQDTPIPAGITRHVIAAGRALRVNLPLSFLQGTDAAGADAALTSYLRTLHPRAYREPTILYDS